MSMTTRGKASKSQTPQDSSSNTKSRKHSTAAPKTPTFNDNMGENGAKKVTMEDLMAKLNAQDNKRDTQYKILTAKFDDLEKSLKFTHEIAEENQTNIAQLFTEKKDLQSQVEYLTNQLETLQLRVENSERLPSESSMSLNPRVRISEKWSVISL